MTTKVAFDSTFSHTEVVGSLGGSALRFVLGHPLLGHCAWGIRGDHSKKNAIQNKSEKCGWVELRSGPTSYPHSISGDLNTQRRDENAEFCHDCSSITEFDVRFQITPYFRCR